MCTLIAEKGARQAKSIYFDEDRNQFLGIKVESLAYIYAKSFALDMITS
jgi:hypothetical protein